MMLSVDDVKVGMFVTILQNKVYTADRSYIGRLFKVVVIDLPFIRVRRMIDRDTLSNMFPLTGGDTSTIDTREYDLKKCSQEFVDSFKSERKVSDGCPKASTGPVG